eukprot:CAMPEP_0119135320 /NCGR_PEP_ID=MMETSP1310-20130426/19057_1 /TAXON_ID=464262 /ORGANISM="Genus nov. species nov., Strain RCC2339" /LENGTH=442 /DNA_ID=CAMNT_0007126191 /DNA_START=145 /DNA_END=1473 /DNA_ORIENTATION=-
MENRIFEVDYVVPNYTVSSLVENMHNMPRVTGDNNFDLDDGDYVSGIVLIAVLFALCGCFFLVFITTSTILRVCKLCDGRFRRSIIRVRSRSWSAVGITSAIIVLVGLFVGLFGSAALLADVVQSSDEVDSRVYLFNESLVLLNDTLVSDFPSPDKFYEELISRGFGNVTVIVNGTETTVAEALGRTYRNFLEAGFILVDALTALLNDILEITDTVRAIIYVTQVILVCIMTPGFFVVGYVLVVLLLVVAVISIQNRIMYIIVFSLLLAFIVAIFLLFGVEIAVSVFIADFCMAPDYHFANLFDEGIERSLAFYYATCTVDPEIVERFEQALEDFLEAAKDILRQLSEQDTNLTTDDLFDFLDELVNSLPIDEVISIVNAFLLCPFLNSLYVDVVYVEVCNDMVEHAVIAWSGIVTAVVFLIPTYIVYDQQLGTKGNLDTKQ